MADIDYGTGLQVLNGTPERWTYHSGPGVVVYSVARRWLTATGSLPWAPGVGIDVRELLGQPLTDAVRSEWQTALAQEALGDERVDRCDVTLAQDGDEALRITATLTLNTGEDVAFQFVVGIADVTVELLRGAA